MKKRLALACAATPLLVLWAAAAPAPKDDKPVNLVKNGSFEEGPDPGMFLSLNPDSKEIKDWVVTRGQVDYVGNFWTAADGKRCLDLHGSPGYGGVKQTIKTKKGQKYKVTFSATVNPDAQVKKKKLGVRAGDRKETFTLEVTGNSGAAMGWEAKEWVFTADADETELEIYTLETEDPNCGPALDNVAVVAVGK
jgi:choice-of-anchor C domain-containing protein